MSYGREMKDVSFRQTRPEDLEFLWDLHIAAMKEYVAATWGWDEALQRDSFVSNYEPGIAQIVRLNDRDIGLIDITSLGAFTFLKKLALLPEYQCKGIGSYLVSDVVTRAHDAGCPVLLQVIKVNPARDSTNAWGFESAGKLILTIS